MKKAQRTAARLYGQAEAVRTKYLRYGADVAMIAQNVWIEGGKAGLKGFDKRIKEDIDSVRRQALKVELENS